MKRALVVLVLLPGLALAQIKTYIALGDSVAWGYQPNSTGRGPGDKGYVKQVADWIGVRQGGVRPGLINLGIPGETSGSFFNTSEIGGILNSNYPLFGRKSQSNTFADKVSQQIGQGHVITHITCALGANDLLDLLTAQFLALPFEQQTALADQALSTADANIVQVLTKVRQQCPLSTLAVPGYYNPYGAFPGSAEDRISQYAIPKLNQILWFRGLQFGARFAPTYNPFVGHELAWTWIGEDDVHPRDPGYTAIANQVKIAFKQPAFVPVGNGVRPP